MTLKPTLIIFLKSLILLEKSISINPNILDPYIIKSKIYFIQKKYDESLNEINRIPETFINNSEVLFIKGRLFYYKKLYKKSIKFLDSTLTMDSLNNVAYYYRSVIKFKNGKFIKTLMESNQESIDCFTKPSKPHGK